MTRTKEEIIGIVETLGYEYLNDYMDEKRRRVIIQDKVGYKYDVDLHGFIKGYIPEFVSKSNPYSLENIVLWLLLNRRELELCKNNIYDGKDKKLEFFHNIQECQEHFKSSWNNIYRGQGCGVCHGLQVGKYNSFAYLRSDLANEWHPDNEINPKNVTEFSTKSVYWVCSKCGYGKNKEWIATIKNRSNGTGCPKCSDSKGEKRILFWIENNIKILKRIGVIKHIPQKKFSDCRNERELPFDFGFQFKNKSWFMIEYYGLQHYKKMGFWGGDDKLKRTTKNDKIKQEYCKNNNIPLLIIPYWEFDNIENILKERIFGE